MLYTECYECAVVRLVVLLHFLWSSGEVYFI